MRSLPAFALALAIPMAAFAQPAFEPMPQQGDPMTHPVTPRDVPWYMAHPTAMQQTLKVCHSNSAYGPTPDCQNAERAGTGLMAQSYAAAAAKGMALYQDPAFWDANPVQRAGILAQCQRHGPGDQLVLIYCQAASASALRSLNRTAR